MKMSKRTLLLFLTLFVAVLLALYFFLFRPVVYTGKDYSLTFNRFTGTVTEGTVEGATVVDGEIKVIDFVFPDKIAGFKVRRIGYGAFSPFRYNSRSVTIPEGVTGIDDYAFATSQGLQRVSIPKGVIYIGNGAFSACQNLTEITVDPENPNYTADEGVLFNKTKTELIQCPGGKSGEYLIPDRVTSINESAFYYCNGLTRIRIPDGVTSIGKQAFFECGNLANITIPDSVTSIGEGAFGNCSSLTEITIPDRVTYLGNGAFQLCSDLTEIAIPESVTRIEDGVFGYCTNLKSITIPDHLIHIGSFAFAQCSELTDITLPESLTEIGQAAFYYCESLTSITIPSSVTSIGDGAFHKCDRLKSVTVLNPDCKIGQDYGTLGWLGTATIYGYPGSTAEAYAKEHGYTFIPLD